LYAYHEKSFIELTATAQYSRYLIRNQINKFSISLISTNPILGKYPIKAKRQAQQMHLCRCKDRYGRDNFLKQANSSKVIRAYLRSFETDIVINQLAMI
jgi:hypothetical protein